MYLYYAEYLSRLRPDGTKYSTYIHARYFEGVCCSKNLSLNRVADDTEPAQGARPDWLGKGERPLPLHLQCRKDGGPLDRLLDLDTWVCGPTTPFQALL